MKVGAPSGLSPPNVDYAAIFNQPSVQAKFDEVCSKAMAFNLFTSRDNALSDPSLTANTRPLATNPDHTIYVGSIAYNFTSDDVRSLFEPFGQIEYIHLIPVSHITISSYIYVNIYTIVVMITFMSWWDLWSLH